MSNPIGRRKSPQLVLAVAASIAGSVQADIAPPRKEPKSPPAVVEKTKSLDAGVDSKSRDAGVAPQSPENKALDNKGLDGGRRAKAGKSLDGGAARERLKSKR